MASVSQTAVATSTTDGATITFTAQAVGANGGSDIVYVGAGARTTSDASTMSCTVDGVTATQIIFRSRDEGGGIRSNAAIFAIARNSLPDPTQTDVDVALTHSASCIRHAVAVSISPDAGATAFATAGQSTANSDVSLNTPDSGIVMAFAYNGDVATFTFSGVTEVSDVDVAAEGSNRFGSGYASAVSAETPRTVTISTGTDLAARVAASFSPSTTFADGAGSSAGAATVSSVGDSLADSSPSLAGTATLSSTGEALADSSGSVGGVATVSSAGDALADSDGAAAGVATVSSSGESLADAAGSASGAGDATGASDAGEDEEVPASIPAVAGGGGGYGPTPGRSGIRFRRESRKPRVHTIRIGEWPEEPEVIARRERDKEERDWNELISRATAEEIVESHDEERLLEMILELAA